ncbi:MAG TPA: hypothetical protein VN455_06090 [Methanotrichaceae archaeon]|nr:hypothetical protein [Methanotrichaceae archaeon]
MDFRAGTGEFASVIGLSGSGKTALKRTGVPGYSHIRQLKAKWCED